MKKMKRAEIDTCDKVLAHEKDVNNEQKKEKRTALEAEDMHQVGKVKDALGTNPVIMLEREHCAWAKF